MQGHCPRFDETQTAAPGISPGIVKDDEFLLREMFDPEHIENGEVIERAISIKDLRQRGFSVHRMKYVLEDIVRESVKKKESKVRAKDPWRSEGLAKILALEVRKLRDDDGENAFVIIDTAHEENKAHASIYIAKCKLGERPARKLRNLLLPLLQNRISLDEVFNQT